MKPIIAFFIFIITCGNGHSQSFVRGYASGWTSDHDEDIQVECEPSGGFYLGANGTSLLDPPQMKLFKINSLGDTMWSRQYGHWYDNECLKSMLLSPLGELVCAGDFLPGNAPGPLYDVFIMSIDSDGTVLWETRFDVQGRDHVSSITQTSDGGYAILGSTSAFDSMFIAKINSMGQITWVKRYEVPGINYGLDGKIISCSNGDICYVISAYDITGIQLSLIGRLDSSGNAFWEKKYSEGNFFSTSTIAELSNGDFVIATRDDYSNWTVRCITVTRLSAGGAVIWSKILPFAPSHDFFPEEVRIGPGDEIDIGGSIRIPAINQQTGFITRLTSGGSVISTGTYDLNMRSTFNDLELLPGGGFVAAGYLDSSNWQISSITRTDALGNIGCGNGSFNLLAYAHNIQVASVNSGISSGYNTFTVISNVQWLYCDYLFDCPVGAAEVFNEEQSVHFSNSMFQIENCQSADFVLYDVQGKVIQHLRIPAQHFEISFNECAAGIYCYSITAENGDVIKGKIVKTE